MYSTTKHPRKKTKNPKLDGFPPNPDLSSIIWRVWWSLWKLPDIQSEVGNMALATTREPVWSEPDGNPSGPLHTKAADMGLKSCFPGVLLLFQEPAKSTQIKGKPPGI